MSKRNGVRPNPGQVQQTFTVPGRTNFYQPCVQTFDTGAGIINFVKRYRLVPRARLETKLSSVINTMPALAPVMGRYRARIYAFWVPDRLYVPELRVNNVFDAQSENTFDEAVYPTLPFFGDTNYYVGEDLERVLVARNSLLNQIGVPVYAFENNPNYPLIEKLWNGIDVLAYYDIFRNYFANTNEEDFLAYSFDVDNAPNKLLEFSLDELNRYFQSQQWLNSVDSFETFDGQRIVTNNVGSDGLEYYLPFANEFYSYVTYQGASDVMMKYDCSPIYGISLAGLCLKTYMPDYFSTGLGDIQYNKIIQSSLVAVNNNTVNMNDLLAGERLYEYFVKRAATGNRFDEFVRAEFGVDIRKYLDIPTFIRSWSFDLGFSHVTATTAAANQSLGSLAGRGVGKLEDDQFNFSADEYGSLIFLMTIDPYVSYSSSIDPFLNDTVFTDMYVPSFDRMGLEAVNIQDFDTNRAEGTMFYHPIWMKYKTDISRSFGNMAEDFDYWVINRRPDSNHSCLSYIDPFDVVPAFNVSQDYPCPFIVQVGFDTTIKQPMSADTFNFF